MIIIAIIVPKLMMMMMMIVISRSSDCAELERILIQYQKIVVLCRDLREQGLPSKIGISINKKSRRPFVVLETGPDLLSRHVMENNSLSLHGWWMSHVQWDVTEYKQSPERKTRQASSYYNSLCCMRS